MRFLDVWYTRFDVDKLIGGLRSDHGQGRGQVGAGRHLRRRRRGRASARLSKFAERVDGGYRIKQQPP